MFDNLHMFIYIAADVVCKMTSQPTSGGFGDSRFRFLDIQKFSIFFINFLSENQVFFKKEKIRVNYFLILYHVDTLLYARYRTLFYIYIYIDIIYIIQ